VKYSAEAPVNQGFCGSLRLFDQQRRWISALVPGEELAAGKSQGEDPSRRFFEGVKPSIIFSLG
jgi:hypothetical protein